MIVDGYYCGHLGENGDILKTNGKYVKMHALLYKMLPLLDNMLIVFRCILTLNEYMLKWQDRTMDLNEYMFEPQDRTIGLWFMDSR